MDGGRPCEKLDWDTEFFGFPVARVLGRRLDQPTADAIDGWCGRQGIYRNGGLIVLALPSA